MRSYNQLTQTEHYQIYALRKANKNPTEISRVLGRHKNEATVLSKLIHLLLNDT